MVTGPHFSAGYIVLDHFDSIGGPLRLSPTLLIPVLLLVLILVTLPLSGISSETADKDLWENLFDGKMTYVQLKALARQILYAAPLNHGQVSDGAQHA
jgi:hypothetical protein